MLTDEMTATDWERDHACVETVTTLLERGGSLAGARALVANWGYPAPADAALKQLVESFEPFSAASAPQALLREPELTPRRGRQDLIWHASDWHIGKTTDPRSTQNCPPYHDVAYLERLAIMRDEVLEAIADLQRLGHTLGTLYLNLAGDIVEGSTMRMSQRNHVCMTVGDQIRLARHSISECVKQLAPQVERLVVLGQVGNHGRIGFRKDDDETVDNHEMRVYDALGDCLRNEATVTVVPSEREWQYWRVGKTRVLSEHGDRASAGGKTPVASIKGIFLDNVQNVVQNEVDLFLLGHMHQPILHDLGQGRKLIVNGSLDGADDYTCKVLKRPSIISQWLLTLDSERGLWQTRELLAGRFPRTPATPISFS